MALVHQRSWDAGIFTTSPWFNVLADVSRPFLAHAVFPSLEELNVLLARSQAQAGLSVLQAVFSPPKTTHRRKRKAPIDPLSLYDVRIAELGELPTRVDDWHDFFNVLAFAAWPRSKRALHSRQSRLLRARIPAGARRLPGARTREQDALTLFDEGGVIIACDRATHTALSAQVSAADDSFSTALAASVCAVKAQLVPFGHALFEHLAEGLPCPLAIPQLVALDDWPLRSSACLARLDRALSVQLRDEAQFLEPSGIKGLSLDDSIAPFSEGSKACST